MDGMLDNQAQIFTHRSHRRRMLHRIVSILACIVVFCTTYLLILPAITMEGDTHCGIASHTHTDSCYTPPEPAIVCASAAHSHTDSCTGNCDQAEILLHTHSDLCYNSVGQLRCTLAERLPHLHDDSCYTSVETEITTEIPHIHTPECYTCDIDYDSLLCPLPETEGHAHGPQCYGEPEQICTDESEDHSHGDTCYREVLNCILPMEAAHAHTDSCYETRQQLTCGLEEGEPVSQIQYETTVQLTCTQQQIALHSHSEDCYTDDVLTCQILCAQEHTHTEECLGEPDGNPTLSCTQEEHTHTLICYSDPEADLESPGQWEAVMQNITLTGDPAADLAAIAKSQLGYCESSRNYTDAADGTTIHGYNRYGAWAGDPYAPWNQLFAQFCLYYAKVTPEAVPRPVDDNWFAQLQSLERIQAPNFQCQPGDLVFLSDAEQEQIQVGIITATTEDGYINAILGDHNDAVSLQTISPADPAIAGFLPLPRPEADPVPDETEPDETEPKDPETEDADAEAAMTFYFSFEITPPQSVNTKFRAAPRATTDTAAAQTLDGVDIRNQITGVTVQWKENQYSGNWNDWDGSALNPNNLLNFIIAYKLPGGILPSNGIVYYQLPVNALTSGTEGTVRNNLGTEVGSYYISPQGLITIDFNDEYTERNRNGETIEGAVSFTAQASALTENNGSTINLSFTDTQTIRIHLAEETPSDLTVVKDAVVNEANGTIRYTIRITSESGTDANVILRDHMNANAYLGNLTVVNQYGQKVNVQAPNPGDSNFTLTMPPLNGGQSYTVTFDAKLNQVSDRVYTSNRAEASSTDKNGKNIHANDEATATFDYTNVVRKSGKLQSDTIQWSIILDPSQIGGNLRGWTLTDTLNGLAYTGNVTLRYPNGSTQTVTLPYTFSQDVRGTVEITYTTPADYALGTTAVTNTANLTPPAGSTFPSFQETQYVDPYPGDENRYNPVTKSVGDMAANSDGTYTIRWMLTIDSSKGAVPAPWILTDNLGSNQYFSEAQQEYLRTQGIPGLLQAVYGSNLPDYTLAFQNGNRSFTLTVNADLPRLSNPVTLSYSSTTTQFDLSESQTFTNEIGVNNKVWDTESTQYFPTITKRDSKTNSSADSYHALQDLEKDELYWTLHLHIPHNVGSGLTIYENMPDGLTTSGSANGASSMTLGGLGMTVHGTYYPFTLTESGGSVEFGSYNIRLQFVEGTNDFTISLPADFVADFPETPVDFLITGKLPQGFVTTKAAPENADYTSYETVCNTVNLYLSDSNLLIATDTQNQHLTDKDTTQYVDKAYLGNQDSVVSYSVTINPKAEDLVAQQDWLTVEDDLSYICYEYGQGNYFTAAIDPTQIFLTLMDETGQVVENGGRIAITELPKHPEHKAYGSSYTVSTNHEYTAWGTTTFHYLLTLQVPDGYRIQINYQYKLDSIGSPGGVQNLTNTATLENLNSSDETESIGWLPITESGATANLTGIRIYKVDQNNYAIHLQGAHYDLYKYNPTAREYQYKRSVVSDGVSHLNLEELEKNTAYYLVETKAPAGYILDESRHYFLVYDDKLMDKTTNQLYYVAPEGFSDSCHMRPGDVLYIENRRYADDVSVAKRWKNANGMNMDGNIPPDTFVKVQLYQVYSNYPLDFEAENVGKTATVNITVGKQSHTAEYYANTTQEYQVGDIIEVVYTLRPGLDSTPGLMRYTNTENIQIPYSVTENSDGTRTYTFSYRITGVYQELHGYTFDSATDVSVAVRQTHDYTQVKLNREVTPYSGGLVTLNESNDWYYTFSNLPAYELSENGQIQGYYSYYFNEVESSLAGFTPTYDTGYSPSTALTDGRVTITNTPPPTTSITVHKDWRNTDGTPMAEPPTGSVSFDVYQVENLGSAGDISYAQVTAFVDSWYAPNGGLLNQSIVVPLGMELQLTIQSTNTPNVLLDVGTLTPTSVTDLGNGRKEYIYRFYANSDMNLTATTYSGDSSAKLVTARENSLSPLEGSLIMSGNVLTSSGGKLYTYNVPGAITNGEPWTAIVSGLPASAMTDRGMVYYTYYVRETRASPDYTVTYGLDGKEYIFCPDVAEGDLTIHNTRFVGDRIELHMTKKWVDSSGTELAEPPESAINVDIWQVITDGSGTTTERYYRTSAITADNNWQLTVSLPAHNADGTLTYAYYIRETTGNYPVSYQIGNGEFLDVLTADHALGYVPGSVNNTTVHPIILTNTVTIYVLPETGGTGSLFCTLAGAGLLFLACLCYVLKKQERTETI